MNRKPNFVERAAKWISGRGFYLVVLVCVAAIGVSGYFLVRSIAGGAADNAAAAVGATAVPDASAGASASAPAASGSVSPAPKASEKPKVSALPQESPSVSGGESTAEPSVQPSRTPEQETPPAETQKPAALVFTWPVNGAVLASFSVEALAYDETMRDWRTHEGIDLSAAVGTRVLAAAAGTVCGIYEDELMGTTVVIDHGEGLTSVYANLHAQPPVELDEKVYTGDVIGAVGDTAPAESGRGPHLHFAMYQDEAPVDPEMYLPEL